MVGYDTSKNLTERDYAIAGATSGFLTRLSCQPFDVIKIRFQLQVEPIKNVHDSKYRSIFQAIYLIAKEEGIKSFWKGHVAGQLLSVTFGLTQFTTFEFLTKQAVIFDVPKQWNSAVYFMSGSMAGCMATVVSFPFDVVRTRLVAQGEERKIYKNIFHAFQTIVKKEGALVLYRGIFPTFLQVVPNSGVQFMSYKLFTSFFDNYFDTIKTTFSISLVAGALSGFCAKLAIYPLDLVKKRIQIQGFNRGNNFGKQFVGIGFLNTISNVYKNEGLFGFYKGLGPGLLKGVATSAMYFVTYEMACKILNQFHKS